MAIIHYEGHSNFRIKENNLTVWIDPFYTDNPLTVNDWRELEKPDVVLVTHAHADHIGDTINIVKETGAKLGCIFELAHFFIKKGVAAEQILNYGMGWNIGGTVKHKEVEFTMYQAYHTSEVGVPVGFMIAFTPTFICYHAGDTGLFSDMRLIGQLHTIDMALIPIGDVFTMDSIQARKAAQYLNARAVIPMHYKTFPVLEQNTDKFMEEMKHHARNIHAFPMNAGEHIEFT